jgi:hypothetical protein
MMFQKVKDIIEVIGKMIFLQQYKRHLRKRIEKNNFGRREEW